MLVVAGLTLVFVASIFAGINRVVVYRVERRMKGETDAPPEQLPPPLARTSEAHQDRVR
jgi:hypothetical protein